MKKYYKVMLGRSGKHFQECYEQNLIGVDFDVRVDLDSESLTDLKQFNSKYVPIFMERTGNISAVSSGLSCAKMWEIRFGMQNGDIIFTPDGKGNYHVAEITDGYKFITNSELPHTRGVKWINVIHKSKLSVNFKNSMGATQTIISISKYKDEIEQLLGDKNKSQEKNNVSIVQYIESDEKDEEQKIHEKTLLYQITSEFLDWKTLSVYNDEDNIEYFLSDCLNYTYIMYDKAHETIKIGTTTNKPDLRLNQLKTANPSIEMIHVFPGTLYSEKELHQKFDDIRKDREWFFNAKSLKKFLSSEIKKHESTIVSYRKRKELDEVESELFDVLQNQ